jgi:hypothetical protein
MNYSIFIIVMKAMMLMKGKGQPGMASTASPLLILALLEPYHVFFVSLLPHREIAWGRIYIVSFRSRRFCRAKVCNNWTHEAGDGTHHAAWKLPRVVGAIFHLVAFPIDFFFSRSSISQKNAVTKRMV